MLASLPLLCTPHEDLCPHTVCSLSVKAWGLVKNVGGLRRNGQPVSVGVCVLTHVDSTGA